MVLKIGVPHNTYPALLEIGGRDSSEVDEKRGNTMDQKTIKTLKEIIFHFLDSKKDKAFIFGSRAGNKAYKFSDIDIGIESPRKIPWHQLIAIEGAFEESDLPFTVDVVDFNAVSGKFKKLAKKKTISLN